MDSARPVSKSSDDIQIFVGIAEQAESRPVGGHVVVNSTHAEVRFEPHVWMVDRLGERHHFWGHQFANVRGGGDGHQLIVVKKRTNGNIIRVCNRSMGTTVDTNDLIPLKPGPGNFIVATGLMAAVGIFPAMIAYISLFTSIREALNRAATYDLDLAWHFPIILVAVLGLSAWLMTKWVSGSHAKVEALAEQIDEAFAENGLYH